MVFCRHHQSRRWMSKKHDAIAAHFSDLLRKLAKRYDRRLSRRVCASSQLRPNSSSVSPRRLFSGQPRGGHCARRSRRFALSLLRSGAPGCHFSDSALHTGMFAAESIDFVVRIIITSSPPPSLQFQLSHWSPRRSCGSSTTPSPSPTTATRSYAPR
jgi:hypothetical protein